MRDYFRDNSMGVFNPEFDVVGPIDVPYASTDPHASDNATQIFFEALQLADEQIDFSQYDSDGDGEVDMVYFIAAGWGANYGGNDGNLLWPHAYSFWQYRSTTFDGVRLGRYACSVELYGTKAWYGDRILAGIGTICHEFSHVLGLPDLYDTDYEGGGGQSNVPDEWSVMSGGSYNQYGRVPTGWGAYERITGGYLNPVIIDHEGQYSLQSMQEHNEALKLPTTTPDEFFLMENRQLERWDSYLPGNGMLVFHVDSTNVSVWQNNTVNNNPAHNYFLLLRAGMAAGQLPAIHSLAARK